jgi:hypothetical protein
MLKTSNPFLERRRVNRSAPIQWLRHCANLGPRHRGDYATALKQSQKTSFWQLP